MFHSLAFHKAGRRDDAVRVLDQLCQNAVVENRFQDAGYYYWKTSVQCLDLAKGGDTGKVLHTSHRPLRGAPDTKMMSIELLGEPVDSNMLEKFHLYQEKAEIYYLYHSIHRYTVCRPPYRYQ